MENSPFFLNQLQKRKKKKEEEEREKKDRLRARVSPFRRSLCDSTLASDLFRNVFHNIRVGPSSDN